MAFQLKQEHHLDKGIYLELLDNPINAEVKLDNWDKEKFIIPIKCIGNDVTDGSGIKWFYSERDNKWVFLNDGKDTEIELTKYQYEQLVKYKKGSKVQLKMKEMQGKKGKYTGLDVKSLDGKTYKSNTEINNQNRVIKNDSLGITWGMSINNATQLMIAKGLDEKADIIDELEYIAGKIMDVAVNGLVRWEEVQHKKDQNSAPNDDDLPF